MRATLRRGRVARAFGKRRRRGALRTDAATFINAMP